MPLPVIAHLFRVTLRWLNAGGQTANTVWNIDDNAGTHTATDVFNAIDAEVEAALWGMASVDTSVVQVDILPLDGISGTTSFAPAGAKWAGAQAGGDFQTATAVIASFKTGLRGPNNRGRSYFPFPTEATTGQGVVTNAGALAAMQTAWNDFIADLQASGFPLMVASYKHASAHSVTSVIAEVKLGTQRRRQSRLRGS